MNEKKLQRAEFLGKWLWLLFLMVIPSVLVQLMTGQYIVELVPAFNLLGQILNIFCSIAYVYIFLKLSSENMRYRTAAICSFISAVVGLVIALLSGDNDIPTWTLIITLPTSIITLIGSYNEFMGHAEVLRDVDMELSMKWEKLWKWFLGMFIGLYVSSILLIVPLLGLLAFIVIGIGTIVVSILKLVYLYKTAKVFKNYSIEDENKVEENNEVVLTTPKETNSRNFIIMCTLFLLVIAGTIWYKLPMSFTNLDSNEVLEVVIFNGNSGKALHITERNEIEHIIENLNDVKIQRDGVSSFRMGYSFKTTIYLTNGEEADGWNNFIINANDAIRKDPFTYKVIEGNTNYNYIQELFSAEMQ